MGLDPDGSNGGGYSTRYPGGQKQAQIAVVVDVAIPSERNIRKKENGTQEAPKYQGQREKLERMWGGISGYPWW